MTPYHVLVASAHARNAMRRGDVANAERWIKIADRAALIAQRLQRIDHEEKRPVYPRFVGS